MNFSNNPDANFKSLKWITNTYGVCRLSVLYLVTLSPRSSDGTMMGASQDAWPHYPEVCDRDEMGG
jgi:hypothetical protein